MSEWKTSRLDEVASLFNGKTPSKAEQRPKGHPVLKIKDVSELGEYRGPFESFVDPEMARKFAGKHVQDGDTLILNAAHNADYVASKTFRAQPPTFGALATGEWLIIRPNSRNLDADFVHHWVNSARTRRALRYLVNGIHLYPKDVARLPIAFPPLPEQRRIAEILDRAEALRAKRRAALAHLDTLTQSIFLDLFGDPATNPLAWRRQTLCEITEKITDGEHLNPTFSKSGMPIAMAGNILEDRIDLENSKTVETSLGEKFRRKCGPRPGDLLLVSRGATIGRLCAVNTPRPFCLMGSVILVQPSKSVIETRFLSSLLKHPVTQHALYTTSGSSAQQAIYLKDLKRLLCIVPPLALQQDFVRHIAAIEKLKTAHRASLAQLDTLFASLQQRAFRGEL